MQFPPIKKNVETMPVQPNLLDYEHTCATFSWDEVRRSFDGLPESGGLNIAHEAVDRHADGPRREHIAIRCLSKDNKIVEFTYGDLKEGSNRFANLLNKLTVTKGERVFWLAGRLPALYPMFFGTLKNCNVFCPLFAAFGPEPIFQRLERGDARVLVTTERQYNKKVAPHLPQLPALKHVLLIDKEEDLNEQVLSLPRLLETSSSLFTIPPTDPEDMAILHFTSGTTGMPKGAVHVHNAVLTHAVTGKYVLDLHPEDIFWCTADPGWVTGTSYGIIAPLLHGITCIVDEADFDAERWYRILQDQRVTVWYTAPTAIRMLMRTPPEQRQRYDLSALRLIHSVGEPLNPEAVLWGKHVLGLPIHDNWWQTETGGIMIANYAALEIRPGSMGRALPGIEAAIVTRTSAHSVRVEEPDIKGDLALRVGWPSMFRAYLHDEERYRKCFIGEWYLTGDLASRDKDGYYWFFGRADDIIKTAGHMVGPFEVESSLMEHKAVAEAGVIGKPDPVIGEVVKAFVVLKPGIKESEDLRLELIGFGRTRLGSAVAPRELEFVGNLPKTRSGKIMRRLLKAQELGLPIGDISTLEESES
ncbi:acetate--CoA ligase [Desulfopila aestuarii]|uniref:acetate--CoA ligase n=1 Tax=Desulfopila aestuarii DSM 18488 TaxID=1121416 RepID=A0A1M7YJG7_9BACT|nr:acetate--CoA ligase [Desulfopila aestuarii]SHO52757.1 acetyl-CoA synthetase [Desulfopila aestuarii DSM 18488]